MSRYLLVKGKAGLGNRLLALLGAVLYARLSKRELYVDWSDRGYSPDQSNSFPRLFARPALCPREPIWGSTDVVPAVWRDALDLTVDDLMARYERDEEADGVPAIAAKYTINPERLDYGEAVAVRWAWTDEIYRMRRHLPPELRALDDRGLLRRLLHDELELAAPVKARVDDFARAELGEVSIGLHIRYSDRKNSWAEYPEIVDKIRKTHPEATVFVATDNKDVEAALTKRYPRVVATKKWYAPPGVPLHRVRDCPDKLELGIEALVDMWLLGRCNYLVYNDTSTFGVLASLLSQAPPENVYETSPQMNAVKRRAKHWVKVLRTKLRS